MGQPDRTNNPRTGSGDDRRHTSRGDCRCGTRAPGRSSRGNGHPEHGSRCTPRVAARCGARTASYVHDRPATRPAVGAPERIPVLVQTRCPAPAVDAVGVADLVALWLPVVVVLLSCLAPAVDAVGVADPVALWLVVAGSGSCPAAHPVVVADLADPCLPAVAAGAAVLSAYWLAAGLVLQAPAVAASPGSSVYPLYPDVGRPGPHLRAPNT